MQLRQNNKKNNTYKIVNNFNCTYEYKIVCRYLCSGWQFLV